MAAGALNLLRVEAPEAVPVASPVISRRKSNTNDAASTADTTGAAPASAFRESGMPSSPDPPTSRAVRIGTL